MKVDTLISEVVMVTAVWFVLSEVAKAAQLRENLGMLVWIPSSCLNQTQRKEPQIHVTE